MTEKPTDVADVAVDHFFDICMLASAPSPGKVMGHIGDAFFTAGS